MERAEAEAIYDAGREVCVEVLLRLARLEEENAALRERVAALEERLGRNSQNSSLPPFQDPPAAPPRPRKPSSGRRPGGQPGHEGRHRQLLPPERVDELVEHWPERCSHCAHAFAGAERIDAAPAKRHQLSELPPTAVSVVEHRLHRLRCPACGGETRAELSAEVPGSSFGPRLQAAVATLSVRNRISRRDVAALAADLFGCPRSVGTVDALCQRTSAALAGQHPELHAALERAAVVSADETGWRQAGERRWLWGGVSGNLAAFRITDSRGQQAASEFLGDGFEGICLSDRWSGYNHLERRALCWAHIVRDFRKLAERGGVAAEVGEAALVRCPGYSVHWVRGLPAYIQAKGWLGRVVAFDEGEELRLQIVLAAKNAALEQPAREDRKTRARSG